MFDEFEKKTKFENNVVLGRQISNSDIFAYLVKYETSKKIRDREIMTPMKFGN